MEITSPSNETSAPWHALCILRAGITELGRNDVDVASDGELRDALVDIDRCIAQLEAQRARCLRAFDTRRAYGCSATNTVAWMRAACRMTGPAAAARVAVARRLPDLPAAQQAFENGDISYQHAATLARVIGDVGVEAARAHERILARRPRARSGGCM